jgi:hypothetical protein
LLSILSSSLQPLPPLRCFLFGLTPDHPRSFRRAFQSKGVHGCCCCSVIIIFHCQIPVFIHLLLCFLWLPFSYPIYSEVIFFRSSYLHFLLQCAFRAMYEFYFVDLRLALSPSAFSLWCRLSLLGGIVAFPSTLFSFKHRSLTFSSLFGASCR